MSTGASTPGTAGSTCSWMLQLVAGLCCCQLRTGTQQHQAFFLLFSKYDRQPARNGHTANTVQINYLLIMASSSNSAPATKKPSHARPQLQGCSDMGKFCPVYRNKPLIKEQTSHYQTSRPATKKPAMPGLNQGCSDTRKSRARR